MAKVARAKKRGRKKGGANRSAAIREYLSKHAEAKPAEVIEALKAKGLEVSSALVSNVASKNGKKKRKGVRGRPKGSSNNRGGSDGAGIAGIVAAADFARRCGSIAAAEDSLKALRKIAAIELPN